MTDTSTEAVESVAVPLEWDGQTLPAEVAASEPYLGPRYAILTREDGGFYVRTGLSAGYFDGSRRHESLDDAKAACEAQWQTTVRQLVPALLSERDALKADFNDCNAERARWRTRAEAAEARVARASQMLSHIQEMVSRDEVRSAIALAVQDARATLEATS